MNKITPMNFILTGATGILGSHILYELLWAIHQNDYKGKVVLLLRSKKDKNVQERLQELFEPSVIPDYIKQIDLVRLRKHNILLLDSDLRYSIQNLGILQQEKYYLIHCAASVNLGNTSAVNEEIKHNNYLATLGLLHALMPFLYKVSYISTAFSSGHRDGLIENNFLDKKRQEFRNPYEYYKAQTEQEIAQICQSYGVKWQIIRPSIICGRLVDYPHHVIPKFLVFYLFGAFFLRAKALYANFNIRIAMSSTSGLNLVPVDYVAKGIIRALNQDIKELNIASSKSVPNMYAVPMMLQKVGWENYEFVDTIPDDQNPLEKLYYRSVGVQLNDYLITPQHEFNTATLRQLMNGIDEPDVFQEYLNLVDYAVEREFMSVIA